MIVLGLAQIWLGGSLAGWLGRLWALRISICIMIIGVYVHINQSSSTQELMRT